MTDENVETFEEEVIEGSSGKVFRAERPESLIFRSAEGEHGIVEGRIVPYNEWTEVNSIMEGHFMESFAPGSMRKTIMERAKDVRVYFEHRRSPQFGPMAVAELEKTWDEDTGVFWRARLLRGLPEYFIDGLRKGLYAASVGAEPIKTLYRRFPKPSDYNPQGIEERVRQEVRAFDFSITSAPVYGGGSTAIAYRSITDEIDLKPFVEDARQDPQRLIQILRAMLAEEEAQEASRPAVEPREEEKSEPPHSEPDPPADPAEVEASRDTQTPVVDYLADETEESWRL